MKPVNLRRAAALTIGCVLYATFVHAQDLVLRVEQGLVTLRARDVTVSEILAQWARVAHVTVVNGDRATGRVTLDLVNEPEQAALATVLRDVSGYMLAGRPLATGGTTIDRILIAPGASRGTNRRPVSGPAVSSAPDAVPGPDFAVTTSGAALDDVASTLGAQPAVATFPSAPAMPISLPSSVGRAVGVVLGAREVTSGPLPRAGVGQNDQSLVTLPDDFGTQRHPPVQQPGQPAVEPPPGAQRVAPNPFGIVEGSLQPGPIAPVPRESAPAGGERER